MTARTLAPCGTKTARERHKRNNETCPTCEHNKQQPRTKAPCGTQAARRRHKRRNDPPCTTCENARRTYRPTGTTTPELVQEIEFLLRAGEGTHRILQATGYTGRIDTLVNRLQKTGNHHLVPHITKPWELAA